MNHEPRSRVLVAIDGGRVRAKVQLPKTRETTTMNYRDFNPNQSCLPAEAYTYLWSATSIPGEPRPTLFGRLRGIIWRIAAALPVVALTTAFLPLADPPPHHLRPLREIFTLDHTSLVWVQPKDELRPETLPLPENAPRLARVSL